MPVRVVTVPPVPYEPAGMGLQVDWPVWLLYDPDPQDAQDACVHAGMRLQGEQKTFGGQRRTRPALSP